MDFKPKRHPRNAPGPCFVEFECCTLCGVPEAIAPALFSSNESGCWVAKRPETPEEIAKMIEVIDSQELGCVRYEGDNPQLTAVHERERRRFGGDATPLSTDCINCDVDCDVARAFYDDRR